MDIKGGTTSLAASWTGGQFIRVASPFLCGWRPPVDTTQSRPVGLFIQEGPVGLEPGREAKGADMFLFQRKWMFVMMIFTARCSLVSLVLALETIFGFGS